MKNRILAVIFIISILPAGLLSAEAIPGSVMWHDFETANYWTTSDWENNSLSDPKITSDYVSSGRKSLEIKLNAEKPGQVGMIQLMESGDMSGVLKVSFDIYNSSMVNMKVLLMMKTGTNWLYHESKRQDLKPGWNKSIVFDLKAQEFGSGGVYNQAIKEPNFMRRFGFMFVPEAQATGLVFVDNIQFSGTKLDKLITVEETEDVDRGKEVLIDSFETGRIKWSAADNWSCSTSTESTTETATEGKTSMKANYNLKLPGQNAVFMIEDSLDLTDVYEMKVDVYYPYDFPSNISMSLGTGDKWAWQEYTSTKLKKGWNRDVTFGFKDKRWKNEGSNWGNVVNPANINSVRRLSLLYFPANIGTGYVIFDNVRMITKDPSKLAAIMPADTGSLAFYSWNSFEKGVNWKAQTDDSGALAVNPANGFGSDTRKGMETVFSTQTNVDKAAYVFNSNMDFSESAGMKFDVYNPNSFSVKITLAFQTGPQYLWIESKQVDVAPGWNKDVFFNFLTPGFKSAASNWNYTDYFDTRNDTRRVVLSIFPNQKAAGSLYFTDFKLARRNFFGDMGNIAGFTLANRSKVTFEPIQYKAWDEGSGEGTFESPASANVWAPHQESTWGVCQTSISDKYASKGKKSLKIDYKDISQKFGIEYTAASFLQVSDKKALSLDIYNPGKQLKFSIAFTSDSATGNSWNELATQITLAPGWNKNVTVYFDRAVWKKITGNTTLQPVPLQLKSNLVRMALLFSNGYEGSLYIDNIRWGTKDDMQLKDGNVEQDISVLVTPMEQIEAKVTFRGGYYHEQNTDLSVQSGHLILRGFGNELTLFSGEPVNVMDDVLGIMNPTAVGSNVMGLSIAGIVFPINTSYVLSGLSLNNSNPWALGTTYVGTARVKTYFLDKNYAGAVYMNSRRGYDADPGISDIFTGDIEQSTHVFGLDAAGSISIPVPGFSSALNFNLKGEALMSSYATLTPDYWFAGPPLQYVHQAMTENDKKMFTYIEPSIHWGKLTVSGFYRQIDPMFAGYYIDPDLRAGITNSYVKATYIMDDVPPFSVMSTWSPEWAAFVRYTQFMAEYDVSDSTSDDYSRQTYTFDLKNDESLALYNYHIWAKYNYEGNAVKIPSFKISGFTKILVMDLLTFKVLGRWNRMSNGTVFSDSVYSVKDVDQTTLYLEASMKPLKNLTLTGSYKWLSSKYSNNGNWFAKADLSLWGSAFVSASYGEEPLTGYWLDDLSNDTVDKIMITFNGRF